MVKNALLVFGVVLFAASNCGAQSVTGEVRDGLISLFAHEPVGAAGIDFQSPAGRLIPVPDPPGASPFTFFLSNTPNQITWGNLGSDLVLDGAFPTQAGYAGDPTGDLRAYWGNGPDPIGIPISLVGEPLPPIEPPAPPTPVIPLPNPKGEIVYGEVRDGAVVIVAIEPVDAVGLDLQSRSGRLITIPEPDPSPTFDPAEASPFAFLLSNTRKQITWGNLGSTVTLDGTLNTGARYSGNPTNDLTAAWGRGTEIVDIPMSLAVLPRTERPIANLPSNPPSITNPLIPLEVSPHPSGSPIFAEVREGTVVLFASEPIKAAGLDFQSPSGRLTPVPNPPGASPFTFFLSNTPNQITWGNLGSTVTLDGVFNTRAGYNGDPADDLVLFWGNGPVPTAMPVSLSSELIPQNIGPPAQPPTTPNPPVVQIPEDGPIFGEIREGQIVLFSSEPVDMSGLDFHSPRGNLVPVDDQIGPAPFLFFLSNTPNQITWGDLGFSVTIDGILNTTAGYVGDPAEDLLAFWGDGPTPVPFPVSISDEPIPEGFELPPPRPDTHPPIVEPPVTRPPIAQGPVSGELRDGKIVVITSSPVDVSGLDFQSAAGLLVPVPDPPGSGPFEFIVSNHPNQITMGNLGTTVTIDGELATEAGYIGDLASGDLRTFWGDGPTPVEFATTEASPPVVEPPVVEPDPPTDPPVVPPRPNTGPLTGVIKEDGFVVLTASQPVKAAGIDLQSAAGNLIPVSDEVGAVPFTFFLSNTSNQITWGNLGSTVTLEGIFVTGAGYIGDPEGDLLGFWGNGPTPIAFAISSVADPIVPEAVIPEPTALSLAWLAMLGVLGLNRRQLEVSK